MMMSHYYNIITLKHNMVIVESKRPTQSIPRHVTVVDVVVVAGTDEPLLQHTPPRHEAVIITHQKNRPTESVDSTMPRHVVVATDEPLLQHTPPWRVPVVVIATHTVHQFHHATPCSSCH